ncbi:MAG: hypothetical protein JW742_09540 [Candidatus Aminicenantes bacterium]|nr:hypothetical protein [Candidatus Aminicenantes bacterium]
MRNRAIVAAAALAWGLAASGGALHGQWARIYGRSTDEVANAVLAAPDGGYVVTGTSNNQGAAGNTGAFLWIVKVAGEGGVVWQHVWECADLSEGFNRTGTVLAAPGGGYLLAASLKPRDLTASYAFLALVGPDGSLVWDKFYGGVGPGGVPLNFRIRNACAASSGGFLVVGSVAVEASLDKDLWAARFDWDGRLLWQRRYGGPAAEDGFAVREESDGTFYLAGQTQTFGAGMNDAWVLNVDGQGDVLWQKAYGGPRNDVCRAMDIVAGGGVLMAGDTLSFGPGDTETWVLRLDRAGAVVWQMAFGGTGEDRAGDVRADADGGVVVVGSHTGRARDLFLLELSAGGGLERRRTFGETIGVFELSNETGLAVDLIEGGWVVAGVSDLFGAVRADVLLVEISPAWERAACRFLKTVGTEAIETSAASVDSTTASAATLAGPSDARVPHDATLPWSSRPLCPSKKNRPRR